MSNSAINTQVAQLKIGNVQNQADNSAVYSGGIWSLKNSTALTSVTITDAGNVGVGATTTSAKLTIKNPNVSGEQQILDIQNAASTGQIASLSFNQTDDMLKLSVKSGTGYLAFGTGATGTERMRIDASGALLIGTTSLFSPTVGTTTGVGFDPSGYLLLSRTGNVMNCRRVGSDGDMINFYRSPTSTTVGSITVTTSSTAYVTTSDYRLKENVQPISAALSKVAALKPCTYKWKVDGSEGEGFIAHELAEVCPLAVVGEKDAVNEDGSIKTQGIDPSKLVALLTAAIQELSAKVDAQAAEIEALKAK